MTLTPAELATFAKSLTLAQGSALLVPRHRLFVWCVGSEWHALISAAEIEVAAAVAVRQEDALASVLVQAYPRELSTLAKFARESGL